MSHSKEASAESMKALYCICGQVEEKKWMIACDKCDRWYHGECVGLHEEEGELAVKYYCADCQKAFGLCPSWKPKCALRSCFKPADIDKSSKYCCRGHGKKHFREMLENLVGMTREDLKQVIQGAGSLAEFRQLGHTLPAVPSMKLPFTTTEQAQLSDLARRFDFVEKKRRIFDLVKQQAEILQAKVQSEVQGPHKFCGFDDRILDDKFVEENSNKDELPAYDSSCLRPCDKICEAHCNWIRIIDASLAMEASNISKDKEAILKHHERLERAKEHQLRLKSCSDILGCMT